MHNVAKTLGRMHGCVLTALAKKDLMTSAEIADRTGISCSCVQNLLYDLRVCGHVTGMRQRRPDGQGWLHERLWYKRGSLKCEK